MVTALLCLLAVPSAPRVLLVVNGWGKDGLEIGKYYKIVRNLPSSNVVYLETPPEEEISFERYQKEIETPVKAGLAKLKTKPDFLVLTKDVPLRFSNLGQSGGYSVDAFLGMHEKPLEPLAKLEDSEFARVSNPYFGKRERFSHAKYGLYLVTRLDGYTAADVKRMVDAGLRAKPDKGLFLFDKADNRREGDYLETQKGLDSAASVLGKRRFRVQLDDSASFVAPGEPLMGYASWGSNDSAFSLDAYRRLRFKPGSIAETFVSTSGRTFRTTSGGQSLIADLLQQGLCGAKGYVSEPYTFALARPGILFERYTSGFNLAESFYMASPVLKWKDIVVGDPLCSPYAKP